MKKIIFITVLLVSAYTAYTMDSDQDDHPLFFGAEHKLDFSDLMEIDELATSSEQIDCFASIHTTPAVTSFDNDNDYDLDEPSAKRQRLDSDAQINHNNQDNNANQLLEDRINAPVAHPRLETTALIYLATTIQHNAASTAITSSPAVCQHCQKFVGINNLRIHKCTDAHSLTSDSAGIKLFCSYDSCSYWHYDRLTVVDHINTVHLTVGPALRRYKCPEPECLYTGRTENLLNVHYAKHEYDRLHGTRFGFPTKK